MPNLVKLQSGQSIKVFLVRVNGALTEVFTDLPQAEDYMRKTRKNGEFWRIHEKTTVPHESKQCLNAYQKPLATS